jgi:hypothetical protein
VDKNGLEQTAEDNTNSIDGCVHSRSRHTYGNSSEGRGIQHRCPSSADSHCLLTQRGSRDGPDNTVPSALSKEQTEANKAAAQVEKAVPVEIVGRPMFAARRFLTMRSSS